MDKAAIEAKIQEYAAIKLQAKERATQHQEAMNKALVDIHQLDGAIGALAGLLGAAPTTEPAATPPLDHAGS